MEIWNPNYNPEQEESKIEKPLHFRDFSLYPKIKAHDSDNWIPLVKFSDADYLSNPTIYYNMTIGADMGDRQSVTQLLAPASTLSWRRINNEEHPTLGVLIPKDTEWEFPMKVHLRFYRDTYSKTNGIIVASVPLDELGVGSTYTAENIQRVMPINTIKIMNDKFWDSPTSFRNKLRKIRK